MPSSVPSSGKLPIAISWSGPLCAAAALLSVLAACSVPGPRARTAPPGGILLKGAGATLPAPLFKRWFDAYQQANPKVVVDYDVVGSGEGIRRFTGVNVEPQERVDFGASDAAMTDSQMAQVPHGVLLLPVTATGVVLAYNLPDLPRPLRLSRKAYSGIFLGEIKNWDDKRIAAANPGVKLPRLTIVTAVRQDASGTTFAFTNHLSAISHAWHDSYGAATLVNWPGASMRGKGNERVAALIQTAVGSVGYVGLEFARKLGLKTASWRTRMATSSRPPMRASSPPSPRPSCLRICAFSCPIQPATPPIPSSPSVGSCSTATRATSPRPRHFATSSAGACATARTTLASWATSRCLPRSAKRPSPPSHPAAERTWRPPALGPLFGCDVIHIPAFHRCGRIEAKCIVRITAVFSLGAWPSHPKNSSIAGLSTLRVIGDEIPFRTKRLQLAPTRGLNRQRQLDHFFPLRRERYRAISSTVWTFARRGRHFK